MTKSTTIYRLAKCFTGNICYALTANPQPEIGHKRNIKHLKCFTGNIAQRKAPTESKNVSRETFLLSLIYTVKLTLRNNKKYVSGDFFRNVFVGFYIGEVRLVLLQDFCSLCKLFFIILALVGNKASAFSYEREAPA